MAFKSSDSLTPGTTYSRKQLREKFQITDATLNTGIFRPAGHDSVWLFITEEKTSDRTQYDDRLVGDDLYFEGQSKGRTDALIVGHRQQGLELLLFYRTKKGERPDYSFRYVGPFEYVSSETGPPTKFHLRRAEGPLDSQANEQIYLDKAPSTRQGYRLNPAERRAVELHAQRRAEEHFVSRGFEVRDVSLKSSFDLHCFKDQKEVRVEVKGTTGTRGAVLLTHNEVVHAREHAGCMALVIVSEIQLDRSGEVPIATGGRLDILQPWNVDDGELIPIQYEHRPRNRPGQT